MGIKLDLTPSEFQSMASDIEVGRQVVNAKMSAAIAEYQAAKQPAVETKPRVKKKEKKDG